MVLTNFEIKHYHSPDDVTIRSDIGANAEIVLARVTGAGGTESTVEFKNDSTFVYVMTDSVPSQKFQPSCRGITGMSDGIRLEIKGSHECQ